LYWYVFH